MNNTAKASRLLNEAHQEIFWHWVELNDISAFENDDQYMILSKYFAFVSKNQDMLTDQS